MFRQYVLASYFREAKMGHYASEMQSEGVKEREWRIRYQKLYDKVKGMSLGCFRAEELRSLLKLLDLEHHGFRANRNDVVILEAAVARNEKLLKSLPRGKK